MKCTLILLLLVSTTAAFTEGANSQNGSTEHAAIHVATALDHLSVLEFGEPVAMAAVGSSAFNVEWRDNKVLIKPLKAGSSTDLFVWTASRRYAYELDPPGEVTDMNFAIDSAVPQKPQIPDRSEQLNGLADMILTRALLGEQAIGHHNIKATRDRIVLRIESVFQSSNTFYIRYSIQNLTNHPYRIAGASLRQLTPKTPGFALDSVRRAQLSKEFVGRLGDATATGLPIAVSETETEDLGPGAETHGVVAVRQLLSDATVLELSFPNAGEQHVAATFIY